MYLWCNPSCNLFCLNAAKTGGESSSVVQPTLEAATATSATVVLNHCVTWPESDLDFEEFIGRRVILSRCHRRNVNTAIVREDAGKFCFYVFFFPCKNHTKAALISTVYCGEQVSLYFFEKCRQKVVSV